MSPHSKSSGFRKIHPRDGSEAACAGHSQAHSHGSAVIHAGADGEPERGSRLFGGLTNEPPSRSINHQAQATFFPAESAAALSPAACRGLPVEVQKHRLEPPSNSAFFH
jgi:hypothetical protein